MSAHDDIKLAATVPLGPVAERTARDMQEARDRAAFDPVKVNEYLRGSREEMLKYNRIAETLSKDPFFKDFRLRR